MNEKNVSNESKLERLLFEQFLAPHICVDPTPQAREDYYSSQQRCAEEGRTVWIADLLTENDAISLDLHKNGDPIAIARLMMTDRFAKTADAYIFDHNNNKFVLFHESAKADINLIRHLEQLG